MVATEAAVTATAAVVVAAVATEEVATAVIEEIAVTAMDTAVVVVAMAEGKPIPWMLVAMCRQRNPSAWGPIH